MCSTSIFEDALAQVIAAPVNQTAAPHSEGGAEAQSQLRFLSLLRRINELRSQQVDVSVGLMSFCMTFCPSVSDAL